MEPSAIIIEAKKGQVVLTVSLLPNGEIIIQDYSENNQGKELIHRLQEKGVNTEITYEGLCG